jgi:hypothetical protein
MGGKSSRERDANKQPPLVIEIISAADIPSVRAITAFNHHF